MTQTGKERPWGSAKYDLGFLGCLYFLPFSLSRMLSWSLQLIFTLSKVQVFPTDNPGRDYRGLNRTPAAARCALTPSTLWRVLPSSRTTLLTGLREAVSYLLEHTAQRLRNVICFKIPAESKTQLEWSWKTTFPEKAYLHNICIMQRFNLFDQKGCKSFWKEESAKSGGPKGLSEEERPLKYAFNSAWDVKTQINITFKIHFTKINKEYF